MRFLLTILLLLVTAAAHAQPEPGDLGVYFDPVGTVEAMQVGAFEPFSWYVLSYEPPGGFDGFELGMILDPRITVTSAVIAPEPDALNVGAAPGNWIVGLSECVPSGSGWRTLLAFGGLLFAPDQDILLCLSSAEPSSFTPAMPGYQSCAHDLFPFGLAQSGGGAYPDGCALLNPSLPWCDPPPAAAGFDPADLEVDPTMVAEMRVELQASPEYICIAPPDDLEKRLDPLRLGSFQLRVEYDPAELTLHGVRWAPELADWTLEDLAAPGSLELSGSGGSELFLPMWTSMDLFYLQVELLPEVEEAVLRVMEPAAWDPEGGALTSWGFEGTVTPWTIPNGATSFGALKATFGGER